MSRARLAVNEPELKVSRANTSSASGHPSFFELLLLPDRDPRRNSARRRAHHELDRLEAPREARGPLSELVSNRLRPRSAYDSGASRREATLVAFDRTRATS